MKTSEQIEKINEALALAQREYKPVVKNKVNPHFKNSYADLSSLIEATRDALSKYGLALTQSPLFQEGRLVVISRLLHKSGQWFETELSLKPQGDTPQALGSAITYGRRYSAEALLGVSSEDDDDGNEASNPNSDKQMIAQLREIIAKQNAELEAWKHPKFDKNNGAAVERVRSYIREKHKEIPDQFNIQPLLDSLHGKAFGWGLVESFLKEPPK